MTRSAAALAAICLLAVGSAGCSSSGDSADPGSGAPGSSTGPVASVTSSDSTDAQAAGSGTDASSTTHSNPRQTEITVVAPPTTSRKPTTPAATKSSPKGSSTTTKPDRTKPDKTARTRSTSTKDAADSSRTGTSTATKTTAKSTAKSTAKTATTSAKTTSATSAHSSTADDAPSGTSGLSDAVVVIDPGHNGANAAHPEIIHQQVPAGFGEYKNCNTTGTETNAGYPEYRFNWGVALAVRDALQDKGITVVMTRDSDDGVGPCVNKRAAIGNAEYDGRKADAVVSIHGDGEAESIEGFYVMTASRPPAGDAVAKQSDALAAAIRDGMAGAGFPANNAIGSNGLWQRSDLAGLNLSMRPTVMIECGNMRNAHEADVMSSKDGQRQYAEGIAAGVVAFLGH